MVEKYRFELSEIINGNDPFVVEMEKKTETLKTDSNGLKRNASMIKQNPWFIELIIWIYFYYVEKVYNLKYKLNIPYKMLSLSTNLLRKSLTLSPTFYIAKFTVKNDNWSKIKQD